MRVVTAPFARVRAAVSAVCTSVMACETTASVGVGVANTGLPVIALTMPVASAVRATGVLGSLREAMERCEVLMVVMGHSPCRRID